MMLTSDLARDNPKLVEKICRHICKLNKIDPDRLYCPQLPEYIQHGQGLVAGYYVSAMQTPIWTSYITVAQSAIEAVGELYWFKEK